MAINLSQMKDIGRQVGIQRDKLPVYESYEGTGNHDETFPVNMREVLISNDSTTDDLTIQVVGPASLNITITVKAYEVLDERFPEFSGVSIVATGAWRFLVRSGLIA